MRRPLRTGLGVGAAVLLIACDGGNVFQPQPGGIGNNDGSSPTIQITDPREPAANPVGDSVFVRADINDPSGIDSVVFEGVAFRGDPSLGTDVVVPRFVSKMVTLGGATDTTVTRFLLPMPDSTREQTALIATAYDTGGNLSADTISLFMGGPRVRLFNVEEGQTVAAGLSLAIRIEANDPEGILSVSVNTTGSSEQTITRNFNPPLDSVALDTALVIPAGTTGEMDITATARSTLNIVGQDGPVTVTVTTSSGGDAIQPSGNLITEAPARMELQDEVGVTVLGADDPQGSGVETVGFTVIAISPTRGDSVIATGEQTFSPPRTGSVETDFAFNPINVDTLSLPDTLVFEVTGYLIDAAGNCSAVTSATTTQSLSCGALPTGETVAATALGQRVTRSIVAGRTIRLPGGGRILDAVVDTARQNLFLSNSVRDQVEIFRLEAETFLTPVAVGSEPWGLTLNRGGDTLMVANSGGTNISNIWLGVSGTETLVEDPGRRFLTPDVVLFDVEESINELGARKYKAWIIPDALPPGFSDRPQYIAMDSVGRVLYSTRVSTLGDRGTIRRAFVPPGAPNADVVMFFEQEELLDANSFTAVANIDDIDVVIGSGTGGEDEVIFYDHTPGFRDSVITGGPASVAAAYNEIRGKGSDIFAQTGRWDVEGITFADTTFVGASGDGGFVVFGEGSVDPVGRIIMYRASDEAISNVVAVTDLMTNPSDVVRGVGLNHDGTLGVARGSKAYFFSTDLRAQGEADLPSGGFGAALHPLHANYQSLSNPTGSYDPDTHLAFLGTGESTIEIIDAFHFFRLGRIFIRDALAGPLRASLPFPSDNAGLSCGTKAVFNGSGQYIGDAVDIFADANGAVPHPAVGGPSEDRCVVLKLYGVTASDGVVVVDVRKADVLREHPAR